MRNFVSLVVATFLFCAAVAHGQEAKLLFSFEHEVLDKTREVHVSPDGALIAATDGQFISVFDVGSGKKLWRTRFSSIYQPMAFSPDGKWLATGDHYKNVRIISAKDGKIVKEFKGPGEKDLAWFERYLATTNVAYKVAVYDSNDDFKCIFKEEIEGISHTKWMNLKVKNGVVEYAMLNGSYLVEYREGKFNRLISGGEYSIHTYCVATDCVLVWSQKKDVYEIHRFAPKKKVGVFELPWNFECRPKFSPDGKMLGFGGLNGQVCLYDGQTAKLLLCIPYDAAMKELVTAIDFSADGRVLAVGGTKGVKVYRLDWKK